MSARSLRILAHLFLGCVLPPACAAAVSEDSLRTLLAQHRLIVIMFDGFGMSYCEHAPMPFLHQMERDGFYKEVEALMPTVTNTNNASICCGTFPSDNGITGNSFLSDEGAEEYMEREDLLRSPTLFEKLQRHGIASALLSSKKKTIGLLARGATITVSPETADSSWIADIGPPPDIYSAEVNYWTMRAALHVLQARPDIRCLYVHTTDYPMHKWAPEDSSSLQHLRTMDRWIQQLAEAAPDAMILITADHDMGHKDRCVDLSATLAAEGAPCRAAISAERDKYIQHHRGFGGTSYVYLERSLDSTRVREALLHVRGVEEVLSRAEAVVRYHLMPDRIGDLMVLADAHTVFGELAGEREEALPSTYRTHGSVHELRVPLIIYRATGLPAAKHFRYNMDLITWLIP